MSADSGKQQAHELIERLPPDTVETAVRFLEFMLLDPVSRSLALAGVDEQLTDQERRALNTSKDWLSRNAGIPHEQILAEMDLKAEDFSEPDEPRTTR